VRKAERAWFLSEGEESEAWGINRARPHFLLLCPQVENVLFLTKWGLAPFMNIATSYYGNKDAYYLGERSLRSQG
jgi:hypothetical protein